MGCGDGGAGWMRQMWGGECGAEAGLVNRTALQKRRGRVAAGVVALLDSKFLHYTHSTRHPDKNKTQIDTFSEANGRTASIL